MTQLSDISSLHWQPSVSSNGVVENIADIDQSIRLILKTPKGSDPHRPTFGSNLHRYIDYPVNQVTPHLVRESVEAIREWETRCTLIRVNVSIEETHATLRVRWKLEDGILRETEVWL